MKDQTIDSGKIQLGSTTPRIQHGLKGIYKTDVVFVDVDMPIIEVTKLMKERGVGDVVVTKFINEKIKPVGMITDRDIAITVVADRKTPETLRASDLMIQPVTVALETDGLYDLIQTMKKEGIGRIPVVDERGALLGIITAKKVLQLLSNEFRDLVQFNRKSSRKDLTTQH